MLVTDMLCWRHEIQPGAKFNKFVPSLNRSWGTYIGHQHHNTPECDVGDWYLMLVPNSRCWWRDLSPTSKSCHQHICSPTSVTNIDVTTSCHRTVRDWSLMISNCVWVKRKHGNRHLSLNSLIFSFCIIRRVKVKL